MNAIAPITVAHGAIKDALVRDDLFRFYLSRLRGATNGGAVLPVACGRSAPLALGGVACARRQRPHQVADGHGGEVCRTVWLAEVLLGVLAPRRLLAILGDLGLP